jgi:hypothetical protein
MRQLKGPAVLTAALLVPARADGSTHRWFLSDKVKPESSARRCHRSKTIGAPIFCHKGTASSIGFNRPEEAFAKLHVIDRCGPSHSQHLLDWADDDSVVDHPAAPDTQLVSIPEDLMDQSPHSTRYKFVIWVTSQQRDRIRLLADRQFKTIQEFLLSLVDQEWRSDTGMVPVRV